MKTSIARRAGRIGLTQAQIRATDARLRRMSKAIGHLTAALREMKKACTATSGRIAIEAERLCLIEAFRATADRCGGWSTREIEEAVS